ncbi:ATP-dependent DNA helicase [Bacillus cereus]|uniref:ATP-dependent DNA helicase n=1 Tax=Bacillus cereus TaxID=1396 RepID=UPI003EDFE708|nr:ATP-dependent DNA helicase [Bacillus cereus]
MKTLLLDAETLYKKVQNLEISVEEITNWLNSNLQHIDIPLLSRLISLLEQKRIAYSLPIKIYNQIYYKISEFKKSQGEMDSFKHHIIRTASNNIELASLLNKYGSYNPRLTNDLISAIQLERHEKYEEAFKIYNEKKYIPGIMWMSTILEDIINNPDSEKKLRIAINYKVSTNQNNDIADYLVQLEDKALLNFNIDAFNELLTNLRKKRIVLPNKYHEAPYTELQELIKVEHLVKSHKFLEAYYHLLSLNNDNKYTTICTTLMKQIRHSTKIAKDFFEHIANKNGFSKRENQIYMSNLIEKAIATKQTVMLEAEVGIGKSYGYLIPTLLQRYYSKSNKTIIVSTSSIVLQDQLIKKDIPKINDLLRDMYNIPAIEALIGKGKTNFACSDRLNKYILSLREKIKSGTLSKHTLEENIQLEKELVLFLNQSKFLDKSDASELIEKNKIWRKISAEKCSCQNNCKYLQYRNALLKHNGIIICNHQQLLAHLKNTDSNIKKGIFPTLNDISTIIIDEAHKLEDAAKTVYTNSASLKDLNELQQKLSEIIEKRFEQFKEHHKNQSIYKSYESLDLSLSNFNQILDTINLNLPNWLLPAQFEEEINENEASLETDGAKYKIQLRPAYTTFNELHKNLNELEKIIGDIISYEDNISYSFRQTCLNCIEVIVNMFNPETFLSFIEKNNKENWVFHAMRKTYGSILNKKLMKLSQPVILVSGTLRVNNSFEYMMDRVGYSKEFMKPQHLKNNFDYQNKRFVYIPKHLPSPSNRDEAYYNQISKEITYLLELTQGRSLILFTNYKDLDEVFQRVQNSNIKFKLLKQKKSQTTEQLIQEFKQNTSSCLFASGSFFEGFDVPGEALEQVILVKLPYPVLDPILEYEIMQAGELRMEKVLLPQMTIQLNQAIGRLIRRETDTGIISILDSRLHRPKYAAKNLVNLAVNPSQICTQHEEIFAKWHNK